MKKLSTIAKEHRRAVRRRRLFGLFDVAEVRNRAPLWIAVGGAVLLLMACFFGGLYANRSFTDSASKIDSAMGGLFSQVQD